MASTDSPVATLDSLTARQMADELWEIERKLVFALASLEAQAELDRLLASESAGA